MSSQGLVVDKVVEHFSEPRFSRYTVKTEHQIQIGSRTGFADVVLLDDKGNCVVIVECKGIGYENNGVAQLKSYLSAADTALGVFANSTSPDEWKYYENAGANRFTEITPTQFEVRILRTGMIGKIINFLRRFFGSRKPSTPTDSPVTVAPRRRQYVTNDYDIGGLPIVQNEHVVPGAVEPSLNGTPYYSEQNGFNWASYQLGLVSCIPSHVHRIVHDDQLSHVPDHNRIEDEVTKRNERIMELGSRKDNLEQVKNNRNMELRDKRSILKKAVIMADGPTEVELEAPNNDEGADATLLKRKWYHYLMWILPLILGTYLFVFYASAVDKAFFLNEEAIREAVETGVYTGIQDIVNPTAIYEALTGRWNLFVLLFPILFIGLAKLFDYVVEYTSQWWSYGTGWRVFFLTLLGFLVIGTFVFDVVLASKISQNIHIARNLIDIRSGGDGLGPWPINPLNPFTYDLTMAAVIFCGFVSALIFSGVLIFVVRRWAQAGVMVPDGKRLQAHRRLRMENEKKKREADLAALEHDIISLEADIKRSDEQIGAIDKAITQEQEQIGELNKRGKTRVVRWGQVQSQVNQFMVGWCRFLAQSGAFDDEIQSARNLADDTLHDVFETEYVSQ